MYCIIDCIVSSIAAKGSGGKQEVQLKILQIILQILGYTINDSFGMTMLNDTFIATILTLVLSMSDKKNHASVVSTSYISARQIVALLFEKLKNEIDRYLSISVCVEGTSALDSYQSNLLTALEVLVKEITIFIKGGSGVWLRGPRSLYFYCIIIIFM